jgi:penicillin-binding protein 1A
VLSGVLKAPSKFSPMSSPPLARARARVVVQKMLKAGYLSEDQAKLATSELIAFHNPAAGRELTGYESAVDYVLERLPPLSNVTASEIIIETSIDGGLQKRAQQQLTALIAAEGAASQVNQGALVVMEPDGAIKAMVGGRNYTESQFNRASRAKRQPGSSFKPFVYLAALERGMTPDSTVYDLPLSIKGWSPRNESGTYRGAMSLRQALTQSVNSVAVRLHMDSGSRRTIEVANRLGIRSELRDGPSLALGTSEVTLLEMTGAYAVFANGGSQIEPHVIERVKTGSGVIIYQRPVRVPARVIGEAQVSQMSDMLNSALVNGTGKRAALERHPAAGKTGTSQDFRDAWFVGYTSHLVGGVWFGNDNGQAMNRIMGGSLPARLWHDVMLPAHVARQPKPLLGTKVADVAEMQPPLAPAVLQGEPAIVRRDTATMSAAKPSRLPSARIDEDFIARALR